MIGMFKVNAYVTEIEPGHVYSVDVDGFTREMNCMPLAGACFFKRKVDYVSD